jgi:cytochrome c55X
VLWLIAAAMLPPAVVGGADREAELQALLHNDCGACHGMTLKGGLGPALTPAALAGRSADALHMVIRDGRPGTAMPPWHGLVSDADIDTLVRFLLAGGGDENPAQSGR